MKKKICLLFLIICIITGIVFFYPKNNTKKVKTTSRSKSRGSHYSCKYEP